MIMTKLLRKILTSLLGTVGKTVLDPGSTYPDAGKSRGQGRGRGGQSGRDGGGGGGGGGCGGKGGGSGRGGG